MVQVNPGSGATSAQTSSSGGNTYRVRSGDTLSEIASRNGISVDALARANGIVNKNRIFVGQELTIPGAARGGVYTVRAGDTLSQIAAANGTTVAALKNLNGIRNVNVISVGQQIRLSGPAPTAPARPAPSTPAPAAPAPTASGGVAGVSAAGMDALYNREAQAGVSNRLHWPKGSSGVTLGPGYDMRYRTQDQVVRDLTSVGVPRATALAVAQGAGLSGERARAFAASNRNLVVLTRTQEQALFRLVVPTYANIVRNAVRVPLNQNQFDALVSFAYNVGGENFRTSTLLQKLNAGDYAAVPGQLRRWNKSDGAVVQGLINRREQEVAQFTRPVAAGSNQPVSGTAAPAPVSGPLRNGADYAARIMASGDARARADLQAGRAVVLAIRTPTNSYTNRGNGAYDDTIAIVQRQANGSYGVQTFRANTEPSARYEGRYGIDVNGDRRLDLGQIEPGSYRFSPRVGNFLGHPAFRPDQSVTVRRDSNHDGWINSRDSTNLRTGDRSFLIHIGGNNFTGSAGCQTMPPAEYARFLRAMAQHPNFSYVLVNR